MNLGKMPCICRMRTKNMTSLHIYVWSPEGSRPSSVASERSEGGEESLTSVYLQLCLGSVWMVLLRPPVWAAGAKVRSVLCRCRTFPPRTLSIP